MNEEPGFAYPPWTSPALSSPTNKEFTCCVERWMPGQMKMERFDSRERAPSVRTQATSWAFAAISPTVASSTTAVTWFTGIGAKSPTSRPGSRRTARALASLQPAWLGKTKQGWSS